MKCILNIAVYGWVLSMGVQGSGLFAQATQFSSIDALQHTLEVRSIHFYLDRENSLSAKNAAAWTADTVTAAEALKALGKLDPRLTVWIRLRLHASDTLPEGLAMLTNGFTELEVYSGSEGFNQVQNKGVNHVGRLYTTDRNPLTIQLPDISTGTDAEVLLKIKHYTRSRIVSYFWFWFSTDELIQKSYLKYRPSRDGWGYFFTFFCGLLLFQTLYVSFQWLVMRRKEYAYYVGYILAVFIYFFNRFSVYSAEADLPLLTDARIMDAMNEPLLILPSFFYFGFARHFIDMHDTDPRLNRQIEALQWFLLVITGCVALLKYIPNGYDKNWLIVLALASQLIFTVYALIRVARIQKTVARFLFWGAIVAMGSHITANIIPIIPGDLLAVISPVGITMLGILIEIIIFNTGLIFKAREGEQALVFAQKAYIDELQSRHQLQSEYMNVRDRIADDLHDDIGSSLSSISIYSFAARRKLEEGDAGQTEMLINRISQGAQNLMQHMSDLVWAIHPRNDSNEKLVQRIQNFALEILSAQDCRFTATIDQNFYSAPLNQEQRKNILLILKEAINNAAKHAHATEVHIEVRALPQGRPSDKTQNESTEAIVQRYELCVRDNGTGFRMDSANTTTNAPDSQEGGNGLRAMRKRAEILGGKFQIVSTAQGTRVCFELAFD